MATAITHNPALAMPAGGGESASDDLARWLQQAFVAERAPLPARLPPALAVVVAPPAVPRKAAVSAPPVRASYMLMLTLSLGTLVLTTL